MIALDTNVLIYCYDRRDPRRQEIALDLVAATTEGVLPWQVACEFNAASRKLSEHGFTAAHAWQRLAEFLSLFPLVMRLDSEDCLGAHQDRVSGDRQFRFP
jgi:predicted nucleic acid-binding protein